MKPTPPEPGGKKLTTKEMAKAIGVTPATVRAYARDSAFLKPQVTYSGTQKRFVFGQQHVEQWRKEIEKRINAKESVQTNQKA